MGAFARWGLINIFIIPVGMIVFSFGGFIHPGVDDSFIAVAVGVGVVAAIISMFACAGQLRGSVRGRAWIFVFLLAGLPSGLCLGFWGQHVKSSISANLLASAHLPEHLDEYLKVRNSVQDKRQSGEYIRGKAVVIDGGRNDFSDLQFELPADLMPADAAEVGSVIHVRWDEIKAVEYTNGAIGYRWAAHATVYDLKSQSVSAAVDAMGGEPPQTTKSRGSVYGSKPMKEIISRLRGVSRRSLNG
jgi:hypothetical protein